jgi:hypothetical protein
VAQFDCGLVRTKELAIGRRVSTEEGFSRKEGFVCIGGKEKDLEGFTRKGLHGRKGGSEEGFARRKGLQGTKGLSAWKEGEGFAWKGLHGRGGGSEEKFARKDMEGRFCMEGSRDCDRRIA